MIPDSKGSAATGGGSYRSGGDAGRALSQKWSALHDAADAVAVIAGVPGGSSAAEVQHFPAVLRAGWRHGLVEQGVDDLSALMEPGLSALLSALGRGTDPRAAALTLWKEFVAARDLVLGLALYGREEPCCLA